MVGVIGKVKTSNFLLSTLKEEPNEAEVVSHKLMLRSGMIRKLASGIYTWLPLGIKVLRKVEKIIKEEMDKIGMEILMPSLQPSELWVRSGRWNQYGDQLLKFKDRNQHDMCFAPTHEEVVTSLMKNELKSYKQLPVVFYQIQTKFRDELRPRFGVMRSREFIMKDAYSFHLTEESMHHTYKQMYQVYSRIFQRLGLKYRAVLADSGSIGGNRSQEFQVLTDAGEDLIAYCEDGEYAANIELAESLKPEVKGERKVIFLAKEKISTPQIKSVKEVADFFKIEKQKVLKTLIVKGKEVPWVALVLRGDHEINETKVAKLSEIFCPLTFATEEELLEICGCSRGSIGPLNLNIPVIVDQDAFLVDNFVCGANEEGYHYRNLNWLRDLECSRICDIRKVVEGDLSPDGKGKLKITRGIEVGHIFELGRKYSDNLQADILDENGRAVTMYMGCYGIGVSRTVAAAIEQCHDARGIIWPVSLAPFTVIIIPINYHNSYRVRDLADDLYYKFLDNRVEVLLENRKERAGVLFADADLIGIPYRIVISENNLEKGLIEYKERASNNTELIGIEEVVGFLKNKIQKQLLEG